MNRFHSARDAKEFLAARIIEEAKRESVSLSEVEHKMLFFSETSWTLPDINEVSEQFDRTCDQDKYERKIAHLVQKAYRHAVHSSGSEYEEWWAAIQLLRKQDHYLSVMIGLAGLRPRWDRIKLFTASIATAALFVCMIFLGIYLEGRYGISFSRYMPSRDTREFLVWAIPASVVVMYLFLRVLIGERRVDDLVARSVEGVVRALNRLK